VDGVKTGEVIGTGRKVHSDPTKGGPSEYGTIMTWSGPYVKDGSDWETGSPPAFNVIDNKCFCSAYTKCFQKVLWLIEQANIPYAPTGTNSNSVASTLLEQCVGQRPSAPVNAPGWGIPLL